MWSVEWKYVFRLTLFTFTGLGLAVHLACARSSAVFLHALNTWQPAKHPIIKSGAHKLQQKLEMATSFSS